MKLDFVGKVSRSGIGDVISDIDPTERRSAVWCDTSMCSGSNAGKSIPLSCLEEDAIGLASNENPLTYLQGSTPDLHQGVLHRLKGNETRQTMCHDSSILFMASFGKSSEEIRSVMGIGSRAEHCENLNCVTWC
jgi:hypothetical protein